MTKLYDSHSPASPPLCWDCKHATEFAWYGHHCTRVRAVTGEMPKVEDARAAKAPCGPAGKLFEKRPPLEIKRGFWAMFGF